MQTISLPQTAWFGPRSLDITLPDSWNVQTLQMQGYNLPAISDQTILEALRHPLGTEPLGTLARGKKEVVIVFDDLTRITRTAKIAPHVLGELQAAGISDSHIRFICGTGLHGVMNRSHFVKKLGEDVVSRYAVYSHNPFGNCRPVGTTRTFQTPVSLNEEYLKCDLRIIIGSCAPHAAAGFGGGGKLILPGLSSFATINHHHTLGGARMDPAPIHAGSQEAAALSPAAPAKPSQGMGIRENNLFRANIDEAADLAGIDFLINVTTNLGGDTTALFCGEWKAAYAAALQDAQIKYRTPKASGFDLVISNSYAKVSESMISLSAAIPLVCTCGGDILIISNAPEGQVAHYIAGIFGKTTYACHYTPCAIPDYVNQVIVYNEYPHPGSTWFKEDPKVVYYSRWEDVLKRLLKSQGTAASVAVIPDATMQYFDWWA
jgi:lactate racemase